jgi:hypothetical protein
MSYSALTGLGKRPICPICLDELVDGDEIACILFSTAVISDSYNAENDLERDSVTVDRDWNDRVVVCRCCWDKLMANAVAGGRGKGEKRNG